MTDARATMAIYRLYRKQWESGYAVVPIRVQRKVRAKAEPSLPIGEVSGRTRPNEEPPTMSHHSETRARTTTQRKGVSSGVSTVVRRQSTAKGGVDGSKEKWWTVLTGTGEGSKGSIQVTM